METFEAVRTLLAVREYQDRPVPEELVRQILEAGRLTASSMNRQPWQFIVLEERAGIQQLAAQLQYGGYVAQAPLAIVVLIAETRTSVADVSRAIQSMLLTAWSAGIGSNWVAVQEQEAARALLGIPGDLKVQAVLPFGYPARELGKGQKQRKPLAEIAHRGKFGEPFM